MKYFSNPQEVEAYKLPLTGIKDRSFFREWLEGMEWEDGDYIVVGNDITIIMKGKGFESLYTLKGDD